MIVPRRFLERRLSALLGAPVTVGRLLASAVAGTVEALDVHLPGDGAADCDTDAPLALRVPRIKAQASLARAMHKRIVLSSVAIERPVLSVTQGPDGTLRLPRPRPDPTPGRWQLELGQVLVVDGELRFRSEWWRTPGYELVFTGILAELVHTADGFDFTAILRPASVNGRPLTGGEVRAMGRVVPVPETTDASVSATLTFGPTLEATVRCDSLASGRAGVELRGEVNLAELANFLPPMPLAVLRHATGTARLAASATYAPDEGWSISRLDLSAAEVTLPPPSAPGGSAGRTAPP